VGCMRKVGLRIQSDFSVHMFPLTPPLTNLVQPDVITKFSGEIGIQENPFAGAVFRIWKQDNREGLGAWKRHKGRECSIYCDYGGSRN
jgi:hypothetical protein